MTAIQDGGPAYPIHTPENHNSGAYTDYGMSLRDKFAGDALRCMARRVFSFDTEWTDFNEQNEHAKNIAMSAYAYADAMLEARERKNG